MGKHKAPFLNNEVISLIENNKTPEQKLWIAVLAKAFDDAFKSSDESAALDALRWIRHGQDFNYVCHLAGRSGDYVKSRMLDKVIQREATLLQKHMHIKHASKPVAIPEKPKKPYIRKVYDYKWLPKQTHDYIDR
tara:strand:- start:593 stop:997 length:405 start_codon:yes stop_codon:yes gene_type:complete